MSAELDDLKARIDAFDRAEAEAHEAAQEREQRTKGIIARLLNYSFHDASYHWKNLTAKERGIVGTPDAFEDVLKWMREHKYD